MSRRTEFANLILGMTYSDIKGIADSWSTMVEPGVREPPKTSQDFLSLMHDWAEAEDTEL